MLIFYTESHRDARCYLIYSRYINDIIVAVEAAKQGVSAGGNTVTGWRLAKDFCGDIRNTRRIAETNREGTRVHYKMENDRER